MITGAAMMSFGAIALDFAFNNLIWSRSPDHTGNFVIGTLTPDEGFYMGAGAVVVGFAMILAAIEIVVINASTIRLIGYMIAGAFIITWGGWGIAWSYYAAEGEGTYHDDNVYIPCPTPDGKTCEIGSADWLILNEGLVGMGSIVIMVAIGRGRYTTIHK
jgi:hypothetical protein